MYFHIYCRLDFYKQVYVRCQCEVICKSAMVYFVCVRTGESLRSCPYLAVWSLDNVVEMTSPCPLLDILVHERSLSRGLPYTCPPPEQFFKPTTYNFGKLHTHINTHTLQEPLDQGSATRFRADFVGADRRGGHGT